MKIEEAARGMFVESTIKSFSRREYGCGTFKALIFNHVGEVNHCSISKKRLNLLEKIKYNDRDCPLGSHVPNRVKSYDDLVEFSAHVQ